MGFVYSLKQKGQSLLIFCLIPQIKNPSVAAWRHNAVAAKLTEGLESQPRVPDY
jgi:hypothetical protein